MCREWLPESERKLRTWEDEWTDTAATDFFFCDFVSTSIPREAREPAVREDCDIEKWS